MPLFDSHNHLHRLADPAAAVDAMRAVGVAGCVVNSTAEADWPAVARLATRFPDFVQPAFGLHPWFALSAGPASLDHLRATLLGSPRAAVGECGLDRAVATPPDLQTTVFKEQLALARELDRPAVIHCVRAWGALAEILERFPHPARFLLHSFDGSAEIARRLTPLGAYFSFSGRFLHPHRRAAAAVFATLPADRLLVESDAPDGAAPADLLSHHLPDGGHHPANLPVIAAALADLRGLPPAQLAALLTQNHRACFGT